MKLSNLFIAVKKISSPLLRSQFSEDKLTQTAELILKVEGIINPLILRKINAQSYEYEVVDGHFEYYAAARAKEIDPQKGEYIGAFVIDPDNADNEEVLQKQIELIRKREFGDNEVKEKLESLTAQITELAESVKKIENILSTQKAKLDNQKEKAEKSEYDAMTVPQLKQMAKQQKIMGSSKMNKSELIAAIAKNLIS